MEGGAKGGRRKGEDEGSAVWEPVPSYRRAQGRGPVGDHALPRQLGRGVRSGVRARSCARAGYLEPRPGPRRCGSRLAFFGTRMAARPIPPLHRPVALVRPSRVRAHSGGCGQGAASRRHHQLGRTADDGALRWQTAIVTASRRFAFTSCRRAARRLRVCGRQPGEHAADDCVLAG